MDGPIEDMTKSPGPRLNSHDGAMRMYPVKPFVDGGACFCPQQKKQQHNCVCVWVYVYIHINIHIDVDIYIHVRIYIYIYMYEEPLHDLLLSFWG